MANAAPATQKPDFKVTDDVSPYRLIRIMNERFQGIPGFSEKPTQYGYSARKSGTFPSYKSDKGNWMIKASDVTEYLKKYYERNLSPQAATAPSTKKVA